jgi:hypothetical protein
LGGDAGRRITQQQEEAMPHIRITTANGELVEDVHLEDLRDHLDLDEAFDIAKSRHRDNLHDLLDAAIESASRLEARR